MSNVKNVKTLTGAGMLVAVAIVLGFFKIPISNIVEIRFGSIPVALSGILFGPFISCVVGGLSDIGGYLVKPTGAFFPGFTVSAMVTGLIFAIILYRKKVTVVRIIVAELINTLVVETVLTTLWLSILYGMPFRAVLATRILKVLIMLPINCVLLTVIIKPVCSIDAVRRLGVAAK